jgi:hypothetical protein
VLYCERPYLVHSHRAPLHMSRNVIKKRFIDFASLVSSAR